MGRDIIKLIVKHICQWLLISILTFGVIIKLKSKDDFNLFIVSLLINLYSYTSFKLEKKLHDK